MYVCMFNFGLGLIRELRHLLLVDNTVYVPEFCTCVVDIPSPSEAVN